MSTLCATIASIGQHVDFDVVVVWDKRHSVCSDLIGIRYVNHFTEINKIFTTYADDTGMAIAAAPMRISMIDRSEFIMIFSAISGVVTFTSTTMISLKLPDGSFVHIQDFHFNHNGLIV